MTELSHIKIYQEKNRWIAKIKLPDSDKPEELASRYSSMDFIMKASAAILDFFFGASGEPMPISDNSESYYNRGAVWMAGQDGGGD